MFSRDKPLALTDKQDEVEVKDNTLDPVRIPSTPSAQELQQNLVCSQQKDWNYFERYEQISKAWTNTKGLILACSS